MTYELTIVDPVYPGRPPLTMNQWRNAHWTKQNQAKYRILVQVANALKASPVPALDRVRVTITQHAPDARRRDADGLSAFRKDVLDALVKRNVLTDDAQKYVIDGGNHIVTDRANPRMVVTLQTI